MSNTANHPNGTLDQRRVRAAARAHGAAVTAYSPLAQGKVAQEPVLREIAEAHGATPAQVSLAWILAGPDLVAIPRSSKPERIEENLAAAELSLTPSELAALDALRERHERVIDPDFAPTWDPPGAPA
ncbi:MAG: aldo/keto reductase [Pseudomonadales bacterium]|nr:aldo/keto reductase [Pseudomonadales bacterium]